MVDPVSAAANVAALVGLADIALRASKDLYTFFKEIKDTPKEVSLLSAELQEVGTILSDIRDFLTQYGNSPFTTKDRLNLQGILSTLKACEQDVVDMRKKLKSLDTGTSQAKAKKLASQLQWVFMKDKVERFQRELGRHKALLLTTLALCGRRNDVSLREQADASQQKLSALQDSTMKQYQALDHKVQEVTTLVSQGSEAALNAIQNLTVTNHRHFDAVEASTISTRQAIETNTQSVRSENVYTQQQLNRLNMSANRRFEKVHHEVARTNVNGSRVLDAVRSGFTSYEERQQKSEQAQLDMHKEMSKKLDQVLAHLTSFDVDDLEGHDWRTLLMRFDLDQVTSSLTLMKDPILDLLPAIASNISQGSLAQANVDWIWSEFNILLASSHEASALAAKNQSHVPFGRARQAKQARPTSSHSTEGHRSSGSKRKRSNSAEVDDEAWVSMPFKRTCRTRGLQHFTHQTQLTVELDCSESEETQQRVVTRISFVPKVEVCKVGILAQFAGTFLTGSYSSIDRYLAVFNIFPCDFRQHIMCAIQEDDLAEVHSLLSSRTITPFDRLENGTSLLSLASSSYGISQVLLQQGADTRYCHWGEHSVLWSLWLDYFQLLEANFERTRTLSELYRLNGALEEDCRDFSPDLGNLLHLIGFDGDVTRTQPALDYLLSIGCDLEGKNAFDETPLLYTARCFRQGGQGVLEVLIARQARIDVTDNFGRGPLHRAIDSYLGAVEDISDGEWVEESKDYFTHLPTVYNESRVIKQSLISFRDYEDFEGIDESPLDSRLLLLLKAGCNPHDIDHDGCTPADYAKRHPILWQRWCWACTTFMRTEPVESTVDGPKLVYEEMEHDAIYAIDDELDGTDIDSKGVRPSC